MKQQIFSISLILYISLLRLKRSLLLTRRNIESSVLLLPPDSPGSLGDEALVVGTVEHLIEMGIKRIGIISYKPGLEWRNCDYLSEIIQLSYPSLHDCFRRYKGLLYFATEVCSYDQFFCLGADVMDGYYSEEDSLQRLKFVSIANAIGVKTTILGFSFNEQPSSLVVQAMRNLSPNVRLCARDSISYQRLSHHLQRPVEIVADIGFLLHPVNNSPIIKNLSDWINQQKNDNRVILGINANYKLIDNLQEQTLDKLIQIYQDTLVELYSQNKNFSFILISHDLRNLQGEKSDVVLAEALWQRLPPEIQSCCTIMPTPCSAAEIKGICAQLDMVISGRMHLAIASLGQGTPAVCITYQGKFEGLFKHFELEGMTIDPNLALQPGKLVHFLMPLIEKREELSNKIKLKLPDIQQLAQANFV